VTRPLTLYVIDGAWGGVRRPIDGLNLGVVVGEQHDLRTVGRPPTHIRWEPPGRFAWDFWLQDDALICGVADDEARARVVQLAEDLGARAFDADGAEYLPQMTLPGYVRVPAGVEPDTERPAAAAEDFDGWFEAAEPAPLARASAAPEAPPAAPAEPLHPALAEPPRHAPRERRRAAAEDTEFVDEYLRARSAARLRTVRLGLAGLVAATALAGVVGGPRAAAHVLGWSGSIAILLGSYIGLAESRAVVEEGSSLSAAHNVWALAPMALPCTIPLWLYFVFSLFGV